jgi:hypothetical protein
VFQLQAAVIGEKRSQVEKEIEGRKAQESAASTRVGIVRDEAATVAMLVEEGLEIDGIRINPGMPAQVFIKTGRGTVALYASSPCSTASTTRSTRIELIGIGSAKRPG